jgi:hypothetical protein
MVTLTYEVGQRKDVTARSCRLSDWRLPTFTLSIVRNGCWTPMPKRLKGLVPVKHADTTRRFDDGSLFYDHAKGLEDGDCFIASVTPYDIMLERLRDGQSTTHGHCFGGFTKKDRWVWSSLGPHPSKRGALVFFERTKKNGSLYIYSCVRHCARPIMSATAGRCNDKRCCCCCCSPPPPSFVPATTTAATVVGRIANSSLILDRTSSV